MNTHASKLGRHYIWQPHDRCPGIWSDFAKEKPFTSLFSFAYFFFCIFPISYRLVLEQTVRCSQTVWFFVMFDVVEVRLWVKMWCLESSMFGHSMFGVFEVQFFGVHSKAIIDQSSITWIDPDRPGLWQSYCIKFFNSGLQCKFIRTFFS